MSLQSANFPGHVVDIALQAYLRQLNALSLFLNSPVSQAAKAKATLPNGQLMKSITMPVWNYASAVNLSASDSVTWPVTAASMADDYTTLTDASRTLEINRYERSNFIVEDENMARLDGDQLGNYGVGFAVQRVQQAQEESMLAHALASGSFFSGSTSSTGVDVTLATDSEANIHLGLKQAKQVCDWLEMPAGDLDRWLVLNTEAEAGIAVYANKVASIEYGSGGSFVQGTVRKAMGFNFLFTNSMATGYGIAVDPNKFAVVQSGLSVEPMRDKDYEGTFYRVKQRYGFAPTGKAGVPSYTGNQTLTRYEGIVRVTVT